MKYLITGAAGFIGFHLSKRLLGQGNSVVGIDNLSEYYVVNLAAQPGVRYSLTNPRAYIDSNVVGF